MTDPGRVEEYGERENLEARHQSLEREDTDRRRGGGGGGRPASSSGGGIGGGLGEENLGSGGSGRLRHGHGVDVGDDEITTLFVSGLPNDVLHREIHNLFRWFPGYQDSIIKQPKGKGICSFVIFSSRDQAQVAIDKLKGTIFDPETSRTLFIEFAKQNSKKRRREEEGPVEFWHPENLQKRMRNEGPPPPRERPPSSSYSRPAPSPQSASYPPQSTSYPPQSTSYAPPSTSYAPPPPHHVERRIYPEDPYYYNSPRGVPQHAPLPPMPPSSEIWSTGSAPPPRSGRSSRQYARQGPY
eukprot:CAMPEP_0201492720 /NCGR_PEP_ID=MMETSP0151_2-20130828/34470_1 /ASSEMBLY_ACC=CAM_ASM_000257 /TAXON_ID=200890 /ORGANISM="Paramoeba atlantica, Strain 621/1 / CCAP 1560/9" /LENGTH=297 /DNA_ID=CAMNT_0047879703 /DNA_START=43 /DNA_END=936 /DNA_ORIENTATION=+